MNLSPGLFRFRSPCFVNGCNAEELRERDATVRGWFPKRLDRVDCAAMAGEK
jgi:hypothetical protein